MNRRYTIVGGSWGHPEYFVRVADKGTSPGTAYYTVGFRILRLTKIRDEKKT